MYSFFTDPSLIKGQDIYIEGGDVSHIRSVLRLKPGETVSVRDGVSEDEYRCHIEDFSEERVHCRLDFVKKADVELPVKVTICQGLPKGDKLENVIQKCTELGAFRFIPVQTERSVIRLTPAKAAAKTERWRKIAEAAAKQSKRAIVPEVLEPVDFTGVLKLPEKTGGTFLLPYELCSDFSATRQVLEGIAPGSSLTILIGPEGGFSEKEALLAEKAGFIPVTLGRRILRTETAAMTVLSWLVYLFEK
ncbi:MAG: 16S rRNA (uracil(1498)-N(3))-methyltransferase [Lachnospiraceae bacterium]|nr:16S rRNA (uracil(1498)-N(3))-methyltransferase [Lachnospiraceae bacterium]